MVADMDGSVDASDDYCSAAREDGGRRIGMLVVSCALACFLYAVGIGRGNVVEPLRSRPFGKGRIWACERGEYSPASHSQRPVSVKHPNKPRTGLGWLVWTSFVSRAYDSRFE